MQPSSLPPRQPPRINVPNSAFFQQRAPNALISSSSLLSVTSPARASAIGKQLGREALRDLNDVFDALHPRNGTGIDDRVDAAVAERAFAKMLPNGKQVQEQPIATALYSTKEFRERFYNHQACQNIPVGADDVFEILDKDCNGFLEKDELKEVLESFGIELTDEEARVMVALTGDEEEGLTKKSFRKIWKNVAGDHL